MSSLGIIAGNFISDGAAPEWGKLCLAARIQNGVLSPAAEPRIWSDQTEIIGRHCSRDGKSDLISCLEKVEKCKVENLNEILELKNLRKKDPKKFKEDINAYKSAEFAELIHHLISQPYPEKPIEFTATQNPFKSNKSFFSLPSKIAAFAICQGLMCSTKTVKETKRAWRNEFEKSSYASHYAMHPIEITDGDGNKIRGTYFKNRHSVKQDDRPTVICCNPTDGLFMSEGWLLDEKFAHHSYDFISFDYRGCADSSGFPVSPLDLYSDADCVYQFAREKLNVQPNNIHFFGYSLGGNICANVKAAHEECKGRMVIDRSFSLLRHVIENLCGKLAPIIAKITSLIGWEMEGQNAADKAEGNKLIVHHPEDKMMKGRARLRTDKDGFQYLDLRRYHQVREAPIHQSPLSNFDATRGSAEDEVAEFLFNAPRQPVQLQIVGTRIVPSKS